jgi:hypothetical protein
VQRNQYDKILKLCKDNEFVGLFFPSLIQVSDNKIQVCGLKLSLSSVQRLTNVLIKFAKFSIVFFLFAFGSQSFLLGIDEKRLLPPLMVMRMLAKNKQTNLGIVKDYLTKKLQEDSSIIESVSSSTFVKLTFFKHEVEIQQYQDETHKLKDEIREIMTRFAVLFYHCVS